MGGAIKMGKNIFSGGLAGGGSLCFVYSLDYARTRLANDLKGAKKGGGERQFNGLADVYKKTWEAEGIRGLYRGFNISFVGIFVYRGFYFGLYDTIMPLLGSDAGIGTRFVVGYIVTVLAGLASYPIDTIRRRIMMTSGAGSEGQYRSSMHCAQVILKNEGFASMFKGAGANILRGVAGAGVLAGFDTVKEAYVTYKYGPDRSRRQVGGGQAQTQDQTATPGHPQANQGRTQARGLRTGQAVAPLGRGNQARRMVGDLRHGGDL